jgi:hypothetical protein
MQMSGGQRHAGQLHLCRGVPLAVAGSNMCISVCHIVYCAHILVFHMFDALG